MYHLSTQQHMPPGMWPPMWPPSNIDGDEASTGDEASIGDDAMDDDADGLNLKAEILTCLDGIQFTGNVAFSKSHTIFINPGLVVADTLIPLPLVPRDAEIIKGVCRQAPFGRGDETVVDESVRKTWELDHTQFRFSNPEWQTYVASLSNDAARSLGISNSEIAPYKLLLYEEGSFFKPHKDSEKVPGMIGTLVICLPSKHQGGSVHLSHAHKKYVFDTDKTSEFGLTSLSWFSDVTHEIKPLVSGYRLVLTYNIIQRGGPRISAGLVGQQSSQLHSLFHKWGSEYPYLNKLVYLLEHQYTQSSLSLNNLKGRDRGVCQSLYNVGSDCQFAIFLARMTRSEEEYDYEEMGEIDTSLEEIKTCDGLTICSSADLEEDEILGTDLWDRDADSQDEGEFTGNESMPATLRYHDTVVVITPINHLLSLFSRAQPRALLNYLNKSIRDRPDDHYTHNAIIKILEGAIGNKYASMDRLLLPDVVDMAVRLKKWDLYKAAVRASLKNSISRFPTYTSLSSTGRNSVDISSATSLFPTIGRCIDEAFRKDPSTPPDWDFWLSDLVTEILKFPLATLTDNLSQLDSLVQSDDLKASFQEWKKPIREQAVAVKPKLDIGDCDFLIGLLTSQFSDSSWLADWFTPMLATRGSKPLISGILRAIHHIQTHNTLPGGKEAFQCVLEGCMETFALQVDDLSKPSWSTEELKFQCAEAATLRGSINVIDYGFSIGLSQQTTELLDKSCANIHKSSKVKYACPIIARHFLINLTSTLKKHHVPPLESVKHMYVVLIRSLIVSNPPKPPPKPHGWKHQPRACTSICSDCKELSAFLLDSETQTYEFRMAERRRKHIEAQLPSGIFFCQTDRDRTPYALVVTKTGREYEEVLESYKDSIATLVAHVSKLQDTYVRSLLGDDLYEELVLLKDIVGPEGVQQNSKKRKATEELAGSTASRPHLIE